MIKLKIKRIDKSLPLPTYQTKGSVGFDLCARVTTKVPPFIPTLIPLNIIVQTPKGYMFLLACRSSLPIRKKLMVANGIGIVDQDYCGEKDEVMIEVINFSQKEVIVTKGERIAQGILVKIDQPTITEVDEVPKKSRGGVGSTG